MDMFQYYLQSAEVRRAKIKFEDKGLEETLEFAKRGDKLAQNFLVAKAMPKMANEFSTYLYSLVYQKEYGRDLEMCQSAFLSDVATIINDTTSRQKGPFFKFSGEAVGGNAGYGAFAMYATKYVKGFILAKFKKEKLKQIDTVDHIPGGDEADEGGFVQGVEALGSEDRNIRRLQVPPANEDFLKYLQGISPKRAQILRLLTQGVAVKDLATETGITKSRIYFQIQQLANNWEQFKKTQGNDDAKMAYGQDEEEDY